MRCHKSIAQYFNLPETYLHFIYNSGAELQQTVEFYYVDMFHIILYQC